MHNKVQSWDVRMLRCRKRMLFCTGIKRLLLASLTGNTIELTMIPCAMLFGLQRDAIELTTDPNAIPLYVDEGSNRINDCSSCNVCSRFVHSFNTPQRRCVNEARRAGHVRPARSVRIRAGIRRPFRLRDLALYGERSSLTWRVSPNQG